MSAAGCVGMTRCPRCVRFYPDGADHVCGYRHTERCVCNECLKAKFPDVIGVTVNDALAVERSRPKPRTLTLGQCHQLDTLTKRWNEDRARRGLPPIDANEALSEGLRALTEMITQAGE